MTLPHSNFCGENVDCTNDGTEFHKDGADFVDGKRDIAVAAAQYTEDVTPAKPMYQMRKFMGSDGEVRLMLGRDDDGTALPFEVGYSVEKTILREDGERVSLLYEITA
jgi:hypothetical protein